MPKLTETERSKLEVIANSDDPHLAKRAMILLMGDAEVQPEHIAKEVELTPRTVKRWLREFEKEGLAIFPDPPNGDATLPAPAIREVETNQVAPVEETKIEGDEPEVESQVPPTGRKINLQPDDAFAEAGRKILKFHFERMIKQESGTKAGKDPERLHEMRVAVRRMRAAFRVFGQVYTKKKIKSLQAGLKETGRVLGPVRDLDVLIENLQHYQQTLPEPEQKGVQATLDTWTKQRQKARKRMLTYLDSKSYAKFKGDLKKFVETEGRGVKSLPEGSPTPYQLRHVAASLIYETYEQVRAYEPVLENAPVETLHQLRIAFKRLRYLLEFLQGVLGKEAQMVIQEVKTMQDHLGGLQDAEVANHLLRDLLDDHPNEVEQQDSQPIANYVKLRSDEHQQLLASFPQVWAHFNRAEVRQALARAISVL